MKYFYLFFSISLCIYGCKTMADPASRPCEKILENDFSQIVYVKENMNIGEQEFDFNEIRFLCTVSSVYSHKVMFDKYGNWDKEIASGKNRGSLIWEAVDLFNDGEKYVVIASGIERIPIHTAFTVLDQNGKDMLSDSTERLKFEKFFSDLIRNQESNKKEFYKIYRSHFGI